jgi:hypothetical protein
MTITAIDRAPVQMRSVDNRLHRVMATLVGRMRIVSEHTDPAGDYLLVDLRDHGRHIATAVVVLTADGGTTVSGSDGYRDRVFTGHDAESAGAAADHSLGDLQAWWRAQHESIPAEDGLTLIRTPDRDTAGLLTYAVRYVFDAPDVVRAVVGRPDSISERIGVAVTWVAVGTHRHVLGSFRSAREAAHAAIMQAIEDTYAAEGFTGLERKILECASHIQQTPGVDEPRTIRQWADVTSTTFWQTLLGLVGRPDVVTGYPDAVALVTTRSARRR